MNNFEKFGLQLEIVASLNKMGFQNPTPIQRESIPLALEGADILGTAQTGTGKTGAFGIPLISHLLRNPHDTALVIAPTRELASQVMESIEQILGSTKGINSALLIGGEHIVKQFKQLKMQPRLIVGTPGRINDHIERKTIDISRAKFLVLDETDRMLDMGFGIQIDAILEHVPEDRQTLLYSATLPKNILKLATKYQRNPARVSAGETNKVAEKIKQETLQVAESHKYDHLIAQLSEREGSIIVFVKTKSSADRIAKKLRGINHAADSIHGDLRQHQREKAIRLFRDKKNRIMVATDVAARGLDIPHIEHVINYDLPYTPEDYIHRIGRTARAGANGSALNLVSSEDNKRWRAICRLLNPEAKHEPSSERSGSKKPRKKSFFAKKKSHKARRA